MGSRFEPNEGDEYIEAAYSILATKKYSMAFTSDELSNELRHIDLQAMHNYNNTNVVYAFDIILKIYGKDGKDAAMKKIQRLLILRTKLEIMKLLKRFYLDQTNSTSDNIKSYCKSDGQNYVKCLNEYWSLMKKKIFACDDGWKVPTIVIVG